MNKSNSILFALVLITFAIVGVALAQLRGGAEIFSNPLGWIPPASHPLTNNSGLAFSVIDDFNNDGYADLVCVSPNSNYPSYVRFDTFSGNGTGLWTELGRESFGFPTGWGTPYMGAGLAMPIQLHSVDVNNDGWVDLVLVFKDIDTEDGNYEGPLGVATYLNTAGTGFRCTGDVDGDGVTGVSDLLEVIDDWDCVQGL